MIALLLLAALQLPAPFQQDGKWGYRNARGAVIPPRFELANPFSPEGIAAVVDEKGWAYIDATGRLLVRPYVFDNGPDYFHEDLARFTDAGRFGFFDRHGKVAIPARFDFAAPFSEGRAAVCTGCQEVRQGEHRLRQGGRWGFIDRSGALVIPERFEAATSFENGTAKVKLNGQWQSIGKDGTTPPSHPFWKIFAVLAARRENCRATPPAPRALADYARRLPARPIRGQIGLSTRVEEVDRGCTGSLLHRYALRQEVRPGQRR